MKANKLIGEMIVYLCGNINEEKTWLMMLIENHSVLNYTAWSNQVSIYLLSFYVWAQGSQEARRGSGVSQGVEEAPKESAGVTVGWLWPGRGAPHCLRWSWRSIWSRELANDAELREWNGGTESKCAVRRISCTFGKCGLGENLVWELKSLNKI